MITPAGRGKPGQHNANAQEKTIGERHAAMNWAQRLKRVFKIDVETCAFCGGAVKVIACIEEPAVINKILSYLRERDRLQQTSPALVPPPRAPPHVPTTQQPTDCALPNTADFFSTDAKPIRAWSPLYLASFSRPTENSQYTTTTL